MFEKKIMALIDPLLTVRSSINMDMTNTMPAKQNSISSISQTLEHLRHFEVPSAKLKSNLQAPHNRPERLKAHCASDPFSLLILD